VLNASGVQGLEDRSRRPHRSPQRKVFEREEALVLKLRRERKLGIQQLAHELRREHGLRLAPDTVPKVLARHGESQLKRPRLQRKGQKRYSRPVPGGRVQMDSCKIAPGLDQHAAIDDGTRFQVLGLDPRRNAASTLDFLDRVTAGMPFPLQRIQTDRGGELLADAVQQRRRERKIKHRPVKPRSPHLNGKVERVQRTALEEFWPTVSPKAPDLEAQLEAWRTNTTRPHGSLGGSPPSARLEELAPMIPTLAAVQAAYDPSKQLIRSPNTRYRWVDTSTRVL
jgi:transposase InsO family protein